VIGNEFLKYQSSFRAVKEEGYTSDNSLPIFTIVRDIKSAEKGFSINSMIDRNILKVIKFNKNLTTVPAE
jgi:hypothetical protein